MTSPAITLPAELCVHDCVKLMCLVGVRGALVLDGGEAVGVLSFTDVLRAVVGEP